MSNVRDVRGRYVDADKFAKRVFEVAYPIVHDINSHEKGLTIFGIAQVLDEQATADVRPNVHGEWIPTGQYSHSYKCSVCGRTLFNITVGAKNVSKNYPFCHCGADMRKGETNGFNQETRCD